MKRFLLILITLLAFPFHTNAQETDELTHTFTTETSTEKRTFMMFDVPYPLGESETPSKIIDLLEKNKSFIQQQFTESNLVTVWGTQDSARCNYPPREPMVEDAQPERQESCDYQLAETRANIAAGLINGLMVEDSVTRDVDLLTKIETRGLTVKNMHQKSKFIDSKRLELMNQRGFFLVFHKYKTGVSPQTVDKRIAAVRDDFQQKFDRLEEKIRANSEQIIRNRGNIRANRARIRELESRKLRFASGLTATYFAQQITPNLSVRLTNTRWFVFGRAGYVPESGMAVLCEGSRRSTDRISLGASAGYLLGGYAGPTAGIVWFRENLVDDSYASILGLKAGLTARFTFTDKVALHGSASWVPVSSPATEGVDFTQSLSELHASVGISVTL